MLDVVDYFDKIIGGIVEGDREMGGEKRDRDNAYSGEVGCPPVSLEARIGSEFCLVFHDTKQVASCHGNFIFTFFYIR